MDLVVCSPNPNPSLKLQAESKLEGGKNRNPVRKMFRLRGCKRAGKRVKVIDGAAIIFCLDIIL